MQLSRIQALMVVMATYYCVTASSSNNQTGDTGVACGSITCSSDQYCDDDIRGDGTDVMNDTDITSTMQPATSPASGNMVEITTMPPEQDSEIDNSTISDNSTSNQSTVNSSSTEPPPEPSDVISHTSEPHVKQINQTFDAFSHKCRPCEDLCNSYNTSDNHTEIKYTICKPYCTVKGSVFNLGGQTKDFLGISAAVICASIVALFAGRLVYKRIHKKISNRRHQREDEDTLFIMQEPEWLSATNLNPGHSGASDTALCPSAVSGDLGDGAYSILKRPGLSGGEYGSVTLHAATEPV